MYYRPMAAHALRRSRALEVALHDCFQWMRARDMIKDGVLKDQVAAVSCGIYRGQPVLDLDYAEDSAADADANFVLTGKGMIVEIQATAEKAVFSEERMAELTGFAKKRYRRACGLAKADDPLS